MADIIKYDVRTYVEELIKEKFPSKNKQEKILSDKREINMGEHFNERQPSVAIISNGRTASELGE